MAEPEPIPLRREQEPVIRREESIREVGRELLSDVRDLLQSELQLARREMQVDLRASLRAAALLMVGGVGVFLGITYLLLAAIFALGNTLSLTLGAVIVGGAVLILGAIIAGLGWLQLKSVNPMPEQTMETLREDADWLRNRMR